MFSLAKDFFLKLVCKNPASRYNASQALSHPWITRKFENSIPLTFEEKLHNFTKQQDLSNV
jgi:serine/threonine protein kinase